MDIDYLLPAPLIDNNELQNLVDRELRSFLIGNDRYDQKHIVNTYDQKLKYEDIEVPAHIYAWAFYQAIHSMVAIKQFNYSIEHILEKLVFKDQKSTFTLYNIKYNTITGQISINNGPGFDPYKEVMTFYYFIRGIYSELSHKSILYFSFGFIYDAGTAGDAGHANSLIFYKNPDTKEISMSIYEPSGSSSVVINNPVIAKIDMFLQYIVNAYNILYGNKGEKITLVNRREITCPEGIQVVMEEQSGIITGFCLMFSYLWLYLIMLVVRDSDNNIKANNILTIIKSIDTAVLRSKVLLTGSGNNPVENFKIKYTNLYTIMTNFSLYCVQSYLSEIGKIGNLDIFHAFNILFRKKLRKQVPNLSPPSMLLQPCKYSTQCESNICQKNNNEEFGRCVLTEGRNCTDGSYCESGNCRERDVRGPGEDIVKKIRKCEPVLLEEGRNCTEDSKCASGVCNEDSRTCQPVSLENGKDCNEDRYCQSGNCQSRELSHPDGSVRIRRQCEPST
jgi:hypothetical protein